LVSEGVIFPMLVLGHRGASAAFPENTLAAFTGALDQGADGVELDVRRTRDGGLAVRHDPDLPDGRLVFETEASALPGDVPSLGDALEVLTSVHLVNVEIKNWPEDPDFDPDERLAEAVVALLRARGELEGGHVLVTSFHLPTIDRVHALAPDLPTGWLRIDADAEAVAQAAAAGHRALHPHHAFVTAELVAAAHAAGLALNTWTVDDPDRIRWLADAGVDAVITNDPATALAALPRT
jgi:glycerophosphoryl diester phosphodiesterase